LAACRSSTVYSEYLLYEPVLRIAKSQGYEVECEYRVKELKKDRGACPKVDFYLWKNGYDDIALEVKWAKRNPVYIEKDIEKLAFLKEHYDGLNAAIIVFGKLPVINDVKFSKKRVLRQIGKTVAWDAGKTKYAAKYYAVT